MIELNGSKSKKTLTVTLSISEQQVENLKKIARERSYEEDADIHYTDLIREAIDDKVIGYAYGIATKDRIEMDAESPTKAIQGQLDDSLAQWFGITKKEKEQNAAQLVESEEIGQLIDVVARKDPKDIYGFLKTTFVNEDSEMKKLLNETQDNVLTDVDNQDVMKKEEYLRGRQKEDEIENSFYNTVEFLVAMKNELSSEAESIDELAEKMKQRCYDDIVSLGDYHTKRAQEIKEDIMEKIAKRCWQYRSPDGKFYEEIDDEIAILIENIKENVDEKLGEQTLERYDFLKAVEKVSKGFSVGQSSAFGGSKSTLSIADVEEIKEPQSIKTIEEEVTEEDKAFVREQVKKECGTTLKSEHKHDRISKDPKVLNEEYERHKKHAEEVYKNFEEKNIVLRLPTFKNKKDALEWLSDQRAKSTDPEEWDHGKGRVLREMIEDKYRKSNVQVEVDLDEPIELEDGRTDEEVWESKNVDSSKRKNVAAKSTKNLLAKENDLIQKYGKKAYYLYKNRVSNIENAHGDEAMWMWLKNHDEDIEAIKDKVAESENYIATVIFGGATNREEALDWIEQQEKNEGNLELWEQEIKPYLQKHVDFIWPAYNEKLQEIKKQLKEIRNDPNTTISLSRHWSPDEREIIKKRSAEKEAERKRIINMNNVEFTEYRRKLSNEIHGKTGNSHECVDNSNQAQNENQQEDEKKEGDN